MAGLSAIRSDPRRRNLLLLVIMAIVLSVLAVLALLHEQALVAPKYTPHTFFPNLAHNVSKVAKIHVVSKENGAFDVQFEPQNGWVIPSRDNYPASFDEVRKAIVSLATLQTIEPKTARVDWLHYLDLDPPSTGGKGVLITLSDDKGHVLASLIIGKTEDIGDASGLTGFYVRKPDNTQSWLVKGALDVKSNPAAWMNKTVVAVDRSRIREVDVKPADGKAYVVARAKPSDPDFSIQDLPPGREPSSAEAGDGVATSIVGFSFEDIRPADDLDFSKASKLITKTFDGLTVSVSLVQDGSDYWAEVSASAAPGKPDIAKQARQINAHASGWAYKLPEYKGAQFTTSLDSLLKPKGGKAGKTGKK